ncbi:MAG: restriction endonuclease [Deltaproteobacteria bacterium]|nr:restriction endonuclease [Deltaproteobacteria bacterium]
MADLGFTGTQANELAARTLLALCELRPATQWANATGRPWTIRGIIDWIGEYYPPRPAENTRETIRDEAVKHFVAYGLLDRNADDPARPTNSSKTNYRLRPEALNAMHGFGTPAWHDAVDQFRDATVAIRSEMARTRDRARMEVPLPDGTLESLSPGGQNPLIRSVVVEFVGRFVRRPRVVYLGDADGKHRVFERAYLAGRGVAIGNASKMPDVLVVDGERDWLVVIEAVASDGPVDAKRRAELSVLLQGWPGGLVFVTAFADRATLRKWIPVLAWETEV